MPSLKDIKLRISTIKNTQQITKAMKMVSAAKLRRAQESLVAARPYSQKMKSIIENVASGIDASENQLFENRPGGKTVILLITTDKGLCGSLNTHLCKDISNFTKKNQDSADNYELIILGRKGIDFFRKSDITTGEKHRLLKVEEYAEVLKTQIGQLVEQFKEGKINRVYLGYNKFVNVLRQDISLVPILPIVPPEKEEGIVPALSSGIQLFEPSKEAILEDILPKYLQNTAYMGLLENNASEHGSRMRIMDSATNNAGDLIERLTMQFNRLRQAVITKELIEIISGAESIG